MKNYPSVPGKGLNTSEAINGRLDYLLSNGVTSNFIADSHLKTEQIKHNVESYIGSVEIPVGLTGPLLLNENGEQNYVYAPAATLEGALVASMNRGSKVVSLSGGINAVVIHQKMVRSPMFVFNNLNECLLFKNWVDKHFQEIKDVAEQYTNHGKLQEINPVIASRSVQVKFVYKTGDAAGQNMTTTCTWHAVLWMKEQFQLETGIEPVKYVIEGNGASDKKVSSYSVSQGRGIHVIAECELDEKYIQKVLHVTSDDFLKCLYQSLAMSRLDGMVGYNINVANAIAAIFLGTGQDMACVHESGVGILNMEKTEKGLYCSLHLPALVIGTLGGGTHLPKQKEGLKMMGCQGKGKVERFAKIIAGFALALEISTFGAIVGGQFAKAHEKLGRNKPTNWLTRGEINQAFLQETLFPQADLSLISMRHLGKEMVQNGIIINLTNYINSKLTGFIPIEATFENTQTQEQSQLPILLKSKPLDTEVIKGLHFMAASIDPALADLLNQYQDHLEYKNCHSKEIELYQSLTQKGIHHIPKLYGQYINHDREAYIFGQEILNEEELSLYNTENKPELWNTTHIEAVIQAIHQVHQSFTTEELPTVTVFEPWKAKPLYEKFAQLILLEYQDSDLEVLAEQLPALINDLERLHSTLNLPKTLIHNDFNTRNIAVRTNGKPCFYDWELAVIDIPHRDIIEFLSFAMPLDFDKDQYLNYLKYHFDLQNGQYDWIDWKKGYEYALKSYLVTRVSFYLTGKIIMDYPFAERVFKNAFRMLGVLNS